MTALTPLKVAKYRDERAKIITTATVIHELTYFSAIINLIPMVKKPPAPQGRNRILSENELSWLYAALTQGLKTLITGYYRW